jgi:lambda family phage portal protein
MSKKKGFLKRARIAARYAFGYDAAKNTRNRKNRGNGPIRSEDIELSQYERDRVVSACLDFKRNNPVVASISRLRKMDVVGKGIVPQPMTGDDALDELIESKWAAFCEAPEITGQMDMRELQQQIVDATLFYGDCGLVIGNGKVEFVDGSRIQNPQGQSTAKETDAWQQGVRVSPSGKPISYSVGRRVSGTVKDQRSVSAQNYIPFFIRSTPTQYRGIPELAPVLNTLQDCDEYDRVEMIAAKVSASLSVVIKRDGASDWEVASRMGAEDQDEGGNLEQFEPGRFHYAEPGEDISVISSNGRPNVDGIQWVNYLLRKIGSSVGIPLEFMLMEIGGSSFSASQGVVLQYQQTVESYQNSLIRMMGKLYRRWLLQQVAAGEIPAHEQLTKVRWQRPSFRWINQSSQVKADMEYYRAGAKSLDDIVAPFGYTADEVLLRKAQNIKHAMDISESVFGTPEQWRELINPFQTSISGSYNEISQEDEAPAEAPQPTQVDNGS